MSIFSRRKRPVSMTIEEDAVRIVRLKSQDPLVVDVAEEIELPPNVIVEGKIVDAELLETIMDGAVRQWGIGKRPVQFLAPDQYVIIRKVSYPSDVKIDELKGHFFIEIGSTLYLPFDDPVFDVVPYIENPDLHEAIIIASKESVLDSYEQLLKEVKLDPVAADIAPLALYRLAYQQHAFTGKEHVLLADLKGDKLTVSIFHKHYPLFMRPVELENSTDFTIVNESINSKQGTTPALIIMELEKLINFYRYNMLNGTASITHLLVNGDYGEMDELLSGIHNRFDIQAERLWKKPLLLPDGKEISARFHRTIGLALKEV